VIVVEHNVLQFEIAMDHIQRFVQIAEAIEDVREDEACVVFAEVISGVQMLEKSPSVKELENYVMRRVIGDDLDTVHNAWMVE
jgi:hypothetical protein